MQAAVYPLLHAVVDEFLPTAPRPWQSAEKELAAPPSDSTPDSPVLPAMPADDAKGAREHVLALTLECVRCGCASGDADVRNTAAIALLRLCYLSAFGVEGIMQVGWCTYLCMCRCVCMCMCVYMCVYMWVYVCMCVYVHVCVCVCMCVCVCVCA